MDESNFFEKLNLYLFLNKICCVLNTIDKVRRYICLHWFYGVFDDISISEEGPFQKEIDKLHKVEKVNQYLKKMFFLKKHEILII